MGTHPVRDSQMMSLQQTLLFWVIVFLWFYGENHLFHNGCSFPSLQWKILLNLHIEDLAELLIEAQGSVGLPKTSVPRGLSLLSYLTQPPTIKQYYQLNVPATYGFSCSEVDLYCLSG